MVGQASVNALAHPLVSHTVAPSNGQLSLPRKIHSGGYYHVSAAYWANGLVNTLSPRLTGPPASWTFTPEGEGRLYSISVGSTNIASLPSSTPYNVFGSPMGITYGSGDSDTFTYDSNTGAMTGFWGRSGFRPG